MQKKYLLGFVVLLFALMVMVPAGAQTVGTGVNIQSGGGNPPEVKAKWEQDTTASLEDGDDLHATLGTQFLPPCAYMAKKDLEYYAVVTDEEDNGNLKLVFADVYHPDGTFKYQVNFVKVVPQSTGINKFNAAVKAGLLKFNTGRTAAEVLEELQKGTAAVWVGKAQIDYCQMNGDYMVKVIGVDSNDNYSPALINTFTYIPVACGEFDFEEVDYGSVSIGKPVWRAGDTIFGTKEKPTVRNIGNTNVSVTITQDDMGFGRDVDGKWMVMFDARMGNTGKEPIYAPNEQITLPDVLERCHLDELDFSIHVVKGQGTHSGTMKLGVVRVIP